MIFIRDIHRSAENMLYKYYGRICDFLPKLYNRYFATWNWHNVAEIQSFLKSPISQELYV